MEIQVKVLNEYTKEIDELRREAYYQNVPCNTAKDKFDDVSKHICLFHNELLVGYSRYTGSTPSVLHSWASDNSILPAGNDIANLSRISVRNEYRGKMFSKLVILEVLLVSFSEKKTKILCVIEADEMKENYFNALGWQFFGEKISCFKPPDGFVSSRYLIYDLKKDSNVIFEKRSYIFDKMLQQGITVKSEIFDNIKK